MKKILLILCLFPILVFSQKSYKIPADSTILNNIGSGKNELVIRNATSNITGGVLTNLGNGVTAFVLGGGSARVVDTIYKNNTKDSIVFTISGIRYAVKDSFNLNTDSQTLSISNDTLTISGGNSVILPVYIQIDSSTINSYDVLNSQNTPPISPNTGDVYLVGNVPTGAWVGHAKDIAEWDGADWVFTDGVQGDFLYNATNALTYIFRSGNWVQTTGIPALNNGNTISSGLRIGTNNARSLTFETNNINRGRFDSVGRFYVYDTSLRKPNKYLQIDSITGRLVASEISGGAFIPLTGTEVGNPVTGDLVFFDGANTANFTLSFSDGLQIYNDKNTNVFSIDGTNSTSTGIILQSDKDGVLDIGSSNVSSRGIVSANDYSANITDLDYTQKIYVDNAISSNRKVDTSYIFRNSTLDSLCQITVINGISYRSCGKDSVGAGSSTLALDKISDAVDTNTINNGNLKQEWKWNTHVSGSALKLSSALNTAHTPVTGSAILDVSLSNSINTSFSGGINYAAKFVNTYYATGGSNIAIAGYFESGDPSGFLNSAVYSKGNIRIAPSSGKLFFGNYSRIYGGDGELRFSPSSGYTNDKGNYMYGMEAGYTMIVIRNLSSQPYYNWQTSYLYKDISTSRQVIAFGVDSDLRTTIGVGTSYGWIERSADKLMFAAQAGLSSSSVITPNYLLTLYGTNSNVGIGTTTPVASAKLEVSSTTSGFLPPRMTATQASAISTPAQGLLLFVTDTDGTFTSVGWWGYNGATWEKLNN